MSDTRWGFKVSWSGGDGSRTTIAGEGYTSREEMERARDAALAELEWTPPRWWQFWRWNDTRLRERV